MPCCASKVMPTLFCYDAKNINKIIILFIHHSIELLQLLGISRYFCQAKKKEEEKESQSLKPIEAAIDWINYLLYSQQGHNLYLAESQAMPKTLAWSRFSQRALKLNASFSIEKISRKLKKEDEICTLVKCPECKYKRWRPLFLTSQSNMHHAWNQIGIF